MKDHGEFLILKAALRLAGWLAGWLTPVHRDRKRKRQWTRCDGSAPEYFFSLDVFISATRDGNGREVRRDGNGISGKKEAGRGGRGGRRIAEKGKRTGEKVQDRSEVSWSIRRGARGERLFYN